MLDIGSANKAAFLLFGNFTSKNLSKWTKLGRQFYPVRQICTRVTGPVKLVRIPLKLQYFGLGFAAVRARTVLVFQKNIYKFLQFFTFSGLWKVQYNFMF